MCSLVPTPPPPPRTQICICVESLVSFLHKHGVIGIGLKQKGSVLRDFQPTMHSTLSVYDIRPLITRCV